MSAILHPPSAALQAAIWQTIVEKSVLVRMDTVETCLGMDVEKINGLVDEGKLRWVWNFNNGGGGIRQLRFLALELFGPETVKGLTLDGVLRIILGETRKSFSATEIGRRFRLSRVSIYHLHHDGHLAGMVLEHTLKVKRDSLETFLRKRWIGGGLT